MPADSPPHTPSVMASDLASALAQQLGPLPASAAVVAAAAQVVQARGGHVLLRAGERWRSLFWVEAGALRLYYLDRQGRSANKNFYLDGACLWPLTPALAQHPVDFWIEAVTTTRLWAVPWPAWQQACAGWPAWQALERQTLALLLDDKMRREQQFLQCTATQRYQQLCATRPDWLARLPLRHLASYLGITDVALSRIRRRLTPPLNPG